MNNLDLYVMAAFYVYAGISHFRRPAFFLAITPPWVPLPKKVNVAIGAIEIILGVLLLFSATRGLAAIGIIVLLVIVFPANVYHFQKSLRRKRHVWLTALRLPIQVLLIWWASIYV